MIRPEDVRFHVPRDLQYDWAETSFFSIYLPEANVTQGAAGPISGVNASTFNGFAIPEVTA